MGPHGTMYIHSCRDGEEKTWNNLLDALANLPPDEITQPGAIRDTLIRNVAAQGIVTVMQRLLEVARVDCSVKDRHEQMASQPARQYS